MAAKLEQGKEWIELEVQFSSAKTLHIHSLCQNRKRLWLRIRNRIHLISKNGAGLQLYLYDLAVDIYQVNIVWSSCFR